MNEKLLLIIPMYNCEKQIGRVLAKFKPGIEEWVSEIVVIDNQSSDQSILFASLALQHSPIRNFKVLKNHNNFGLGGSHKVGFNYALKNNFDYVAILHGDDQGDINDLIPVLASGNHRTADCCLGARFMRQSILKNYSKFRTFGNYVFNFLFSIVTGRMLYDLGSGLNIYRRSFLEKKIYLRCPNKLTFNYFLLLFTIGNKYTYSFFPISWGEDDQVSNVKLFRQTVTMLRVLLKYLLNKKRFLAESYEIHQIYEADIVCSSSEMAYDKKMQ